MYPFLINREMLVVKRLFRIILLIESKSILIPNRLPIYLHYKVKDIWMSFMTYHLRIILLGKDIRPIILNSRLKSHSHILCLRQVIECIVNIHIGKAIVSDTNGKYLFVDTYISIGNRNKMITAYVKATVISPHNISKEQKEKENYF